MHGIDRPRPEPGAGRRLLSPGATSRRNGAARARTRRELLDSSGAHARSPAGSGAGHAPGTCRRAAVSVPPSGSCSSGPRERSTPDGLPGRIENDDRDRANGREGALERRAVSGRSARRRHGYREAPIRSLRSTRSRRSMSRPSARLVPGSPGSESARTHSRRRSQLTTGGRSRGDAVPATAASRPRSPRDQRATASGFPRPVCPSAPACRMAAAMSSAIIRRLLFSM